MKPSEITVTDMLREAKREAAMRRAVFTKRVKQGDMSITDANEKVALMDAIVRFLTPFAKQEEDAKSRSEPRLFGDVAQVEPPASTFDAET